MRGKEVGREKKKGGKEGHWGGRVVPDDDGRSPGAL